MYLSDLLEYKVKNGDKYISIEFGYIITIIGADKGCILYEINKNTVPMETKQFNRMFRKYESFN